MKLRTVAAAVAALLATDAKPSEAQIMAACLAADKKGKDEGGLGPVENQKKAQDAKDAAAEFYGKAKDEWEKMDDKAKDKARDEFEKKAAEDGPDMEGLDEEGAPNVQPAKSAKGNSGEGGAEPTKDEKEKEEKAMDAKISAALRANDAKHEALRAVEPVLGKVTFDSADKAYKAALDKMGIDTTDVPAAAYPAMFKLAKDKVAAATPVIAVDASTVKGMREAIPGYGRL